MADAIHEKEKLNRLDDEDNYETLKSPEELKMQEDVERAGLLQNSVESALDTPHVPETSSAKTAALWMVVNTLATIGIVKTTFHLNRL